ncbi:hypothetical protein ACH5RR_009073 [Cinchona calisaya]|uniref:FAR1 domain-containing protein n=1 Tax=Cinchona calisaya TaxID=153742 RepID=A0ABD3AFM1_9GENT
MGLNVVKDLVKIHSLISKELIPALGMQFDTKHKAYQFYLAYAKEVGFGIKRSKGLKDNNGKIIDGTFCYSVEGKWGKDKRNMNVRGVRLETRCGCLARMKVNCRLSDKYRVVEFLPNTIITFQVQKKRNFTELTGG